MPIFLTSKSHNVHEVVLPKHLEFEAFRSSDIESDHKFRVLLRRESSSVTDSDEQLITSAASWTHFALKAVDEYFPKSDKENIYQWFNKYLRNSNARESIK